MTALVAGVLFATLAASSQTSGKNGLFTAAQASAGRVAYEKSCGRCHTLTLLGRHGDPGETPAINSLSKGDRQFLADWNGLVPPLAGKEFLERWGAKTVAQLVSRFQDAKFSFREAGLTDDEDVVRITAYILSRNGAKPGNQALTRQTSAVVNSVVE